MEDDEFVLMIDGIALVRDGHQHVSKEEARNGIIGHNTHWHRIDGARSGKSIVHKRVGNEREVIAQFTMNSPDELAGHLRSSPTLLEALGGIFTNKARRWFNEFLINEDSARGAINFSKGADEKSINIEIAIRLDAGMNVLRGETPVELNVETLAWLKHIENSGLIHFRWFDEGSASLDVLHNLRVTCHA